MKQRLQLLWSDAAITQLRTLTIAGTDFAKLKVVMRKLRDGERARAKQFHDHALGRELAGWRSVTIGTALWPPIGTSASSWSTVLLASQSTLGMSIYTTKRTKPQKRVELRCAPAVVNGVCPLSKCQQLHAPIQLLAMFKVQK